MKIYTWVLHRNGVMTDSGIGTVNAITKRLVAQSLPGRVPLDWVIEEMKSNTEKDGTGIFHHNIIPSNEWKLIWTKLTTDRAN